MMISQETAFVIIVAAGIIGYAVGNLLILYAIHKNWL